jgi:hypothetical protein
MTWIRLRIAFLATVCAAVYLVGGVFAPAIALACEGATEEPRLVNGEGKELVKNNFRGSSAKTRLEKEVSTSRIECQKDAVAGQETEAETGKMTIYLRECKNLLGVECAGPTGAKPGELIIPVSWVLDKLDVSGALVLVSTIEKPPFKFECGAVENKAKGAFEIKVKIGKLGAVQEFEIAQKEGVQEPDEYVNGKKEDIKATLELSTEGGAFEQAGIEGNEEITFEEEVEFLE